MLSVVVGVVAAETGSTVARKRNETIPVAIDK
jgi:hypothetical protein